VWAGVDNAWEQEKLEARKMLENGAESHLSTVRFVRPRLAEVATSDKRLFEQFNIFGWVEEQCGVTHGTHVDHLHGAPK